MRDKKKLYNLWFIVLVTCAITKSTAKYDNSINRLLHKLYSNGSLSSKMLLEGSREIVSEKSSYKSMIDWRSPYRPQNLTGDHEHAMSKLHKYLTRIDFKNPDVLSEPISKLENPPQNPILLLIAHIPPINENTLVNLTRIEIKDTGLTNDTSNVDDLTRINTKSSSKKYPSDKNNGLQKNPSLMESILNPFFLKVFKSNESANQKKLAKSKKINNSSIESKKVNKVYTKDSLKKKSSTEKTSVKNDFFNGDILLVNKRPRLQCSKLHSISDTFESPYYRFKSTNGRRFRIFGKNFEDGWIGRNVNKSMLEEDLLRYKDDEMISKPVRLGDLVVNEDPMGTLINQTLLNFSSEIFSLLQEDTTNSSAEEASANKFWNKIKKKFTGLNLSSHNSLPYELIRSSNHSIPSW
ncbi:uncharacterized protein [Halyomorpha halys]|uniref:uncharacterized protein n=1 Tax=Halyomorpha halys TaxID=286706 RepID=UPI0006D4E04E|nr:uncharacterized protein LOC106682168 [Halyomorpha halys]